MTGDAFTVVVDGLDQLRREASGFRSALRTSVQTRLEDVARADVAVIRRRLMTRPHRRDVGLAAGLAAGVRWVRVGDARTAGVQVAASAIGLPAKRRLMLYAFNRRSFRHPTFGHADRLVTQSGRPYFRAVLDQRDKDAAAAVQAGAADAAATVRTAQVTA